MSRKIILIKQELLLLVYELNRSGLLAENEKIRPILAQLEKLRSEERFSRNAETDLVCRLLLEKKKDVLGKPDPPSSGLETQEDPLWRAVKEEPGGHHIDVGEHD